MALLCGAGSKVQLLHSRSPAHDVDEASDVVVAQKLDLEGGCSQTYQHGVLRADVQDRLRRLVVRVVERHRGRALKCRDALERFRHAPRCFALRHGLDRRPLQPRRGASLPQRATGAPLRS